MEIAWPRGGATPKQPSIGASGSVKLAQLGRGRDQRGGSALDIDLPLGQRPALGQLARKPGIDDIRGDDGAGVADRAVGRDAVEVYDQRIARLGALDVERAGLRVAARRGLAVAGVFAHRIDRGGDDGVAIGDPQHRLVRADRGVVVAGREVVGGHGFLFLLLMIYD